MTIACPIARSASERIAVAFGAEQIRYDALEERVRRAGAGLDAGGVKAGDRVALLARNHPDILALLFALLRRGAALVPLNARLTPGEIQAQIARARPAQVIADEALLGGVPGARPMAELFARPGAAPTSDLGWPEDALALLLFTSGTTGFPRAACLSAGNLEAAARASAERVGAAAGDRWLCTLPLFHVGGLAMSYRALWAGARLVLEPRFDAARAWELLWAQEITHASFVPTTLRRVLDASGEERAPSTLRAVLVGGGPVSLGLWRRARERGMPVLQTYGLTESTSQICTELPAFADGQTAGPPLTGCGVRVMSAAGLPVPAGAVGEVEVRGPTVTTGYFGDEAATRVSFRDGWFRTGDLGALDAAGCLRVEARRTDLILSGGENVYPAELEAVLLDHPAVADAAVIGAVDEEWGQIPVAFVAVRGGEPASSGWLESWCRERLGGFKVPKRFVDLPELPRNAAGKVNRDALRRLLANEKAPSAPPQSERGSGYADAARRET